MSWANVFLQQIIRWIVSLSANNYWLWAMNVFQYLRWRVSITFVISMSRKVTKFHIYSCFPEPSFPPQTCQISIGFRACTGKCFHLNNMMQLLIHALNAIAVNDTTVEFGAWLNNYTHSHKIMGVITYPCSNMSKTLQATGNHSSKGLSRNDDTSST